MVGTVVAPVSAMTSGREFGVPRAHRHISAGKRLAFELDLALDAQVTHRPLTSQRRYWCGQ
jgi:hypothetical protein